MKMPPKTAKAAKPADLDKQIDEAAEKYYSASQTIKEAEGVKSGANQTIKAMAELFGHKNGAERLIVTSKNECGYLEVTQHELDRAKAKKLLSPRVFEKIDYRPPNIIDPAEFVRLVDAGAITPDQAKQIIISKPPVLRIIVRPKKGSPTP